MSDIQKAIEDPDKFESCDKFTKKIGLFFINDFYEKAGLRNLPYVKNDLLSTRSIATMMQIKNKEDIHEMVDCTFDDIHALEIELTAEIRARTQVLFDESTKVGGVSWELLKHFAMLPGYPKDQLIVSASFSWN